MSQIDGTRKPTHRLRDRRQASVRNVGITWALKEPPARPPPRALGGGKEDGVPPLFMALEMPVQGLLSCRSVAFLFDTQ